jgi:hypothetical protein
LWLDAADAAQLVVSEEVTLMAWGNALIEAVHWEGEVIIGVDNLFNNEMARAALTFLFGAGVIAGGIYLIGAGVVLLTHETWIARVVERLKQ